jgi:hypothetical protein
MSEVRGFSGLLEGDPPQVEGFAGGSGADREPCPGGEGQPGGVVGVAGDGEVAVMVAVMVVVALCRSWDYADCGVKVVGVQGFALIVVGIITGRRGRLIRRSD